MLSRALRVSRRRYKPSTVEVMVSRWRSFCEASKAFRTDSDWLDEEGLRQTLAKFPAYTTRKRQFLLFRWVARTLAQGGISVPDPSAALERDFVAEERPLHTVVALETHTERMAAQALETVSGWKGLRLAALVRLLGDTGLRSEDVRLLARAAIAFDGGGTGVLTIASKKQSARHLPLSKATCVALQAWIAARPACPGELLFVADESGKALDPATLWRQLKRLETTVGPMGAPVSGTTAIRAAYAQELRAKGLSLEDIQVALGHKKLSSTLELLDRIVPAERQRRQRRGSSSERSNSS